MQLRSSVTQMNNQQLIDDLYSKTVSSARCLITFDHILFRHQDPNAESYLRDTALVKTFEGS